MTVGYTEKLNQETFRTMDARNAENAEILEDPTKHTVINPDGSVDPKATRNLKRVIVNSANNAVLSDVVSKLTGQVYKNAKTAMQNK